MAVGMRNRVPLGRRTMLADRRRLATSALGVGASIALILLLEGLWGGLLIQISAYEDHVNTSFFVRQTGTKTLAEGVVPTSALQNVRAVGGVQEADAVIARSVILDLHGTRQAALVIGYRPGGLGGPWRMSAGRAVQRDDEVVIDETLAADHGIALNDRMSLLGRSMRVVGFSTGTRSFMGVTLVFVSDHTAIQLFAMPKTATFILARASDPAAAATAITGRTGLAVVQTSTVAAADRALYTRIFGSPLKLMVLIAFAAGTLIVALTTYSAIVDRVREYGIVRAMGATNRRLFAVVLGQTLVLTTFGTIAGWFLMAAATRIIAVLRPQFLVSLSPGTAVGIVAAAALMALLAAIVPTRRVTRLDPASVYRG